MATSILLEIPRTIRNFALISADEYPFPLGLHDRICLATKQVIYREKGNMFYAVVNRNADVLVPYYCFANDINIETVYVSPIVHCRFARTPQMAFNNCINLREVRMPKVDLSGETEMYKMFANCPVLEKVSIDLIPTICNCYALFSGCSSLMPENIIVGGKSNTFHIDIPWNAFVGYQNLTGSWRDTEPLDLLLREHNNYEHDFLLLLPALPTCRAANAISRTTVPTHLDIFQLVYAVLTAQFIARGGLVADFSNYLRDCAIDSLLETIDNGVPIADIFSMNNDRIYACWDKFCRLNGFIGGEPLTL